MIFYVENDNDIVIDGFRKANPHGYKNDAEFQFTLRDENGAAVSGASSVALSYVASSNGKYVGVLPGTVSIVDGQEYELTIVDVNLYATKFKIVRSGCRARVRTG